MQCVPCCHPSLKGWSSWPSAAGMHPAVMPRIPPPLQTAPPHTFFPAGVRNAPTGTCQMKLSPAVSEERKQFGSPEHVRAHGRWPLPSWEGKHLFPEASSAWTCKKSWGKKAELCLPSPFPAALRKEGNRRHPFKTSMSVTTTAWTKPDVISRAVKPDTAQTALRTG